MRAWMWRRSSSSLVSPAPRRAPAPPPPPPPWRLRLSPIPWSRGRRYFKRASSVCNLPSPVTARLRKISRISMVRSITSTPTAVEMLRIWLPVSSPSKTAHWAPSCWAARRASSSLPLPRTVPVSGVERFCTTSPTASMWLASHRAASSFRLRSQSKAPWSSASSRVGVGGVSTKISYNSLKVCPFSSARRPASKDRYGRAPACRRICGRCRRGARQSPPSASPGRWQGFPPHGSRPATGCPSG